MPLVGCAASDSIDTSGSTPSGSSTTGSGGQGGFTSSQSGGGGQSSGGGTSVSSSGNGGGGASGSGGAGGILGSGGAGGILGSGGAGGAGGAGGSVVIPEGSLQLCVLNESGAFDPCETPEELDFGTVAAGKQEMRLFRLDNETIGDVTVSSAKTTSPDFSIVVVRYVADPDNPGTPAREVLSLPFTSPKGTALYFEVTYTSQGLASGPIPADTVVVKSTTVGGTALQNDVPIVGELLACGPGTAACDADPDNGCDTSSDTDVNNCGACGNTCSFANAGATCEAGICKIGACTGTNADCDGIASNGCEVNTKDDGLNCGGCGTSCERANASTLCSNSICFANCAAGFKDCDSVDATGCETDIFSDLNNCGGCAIKCDYANATESCNSGACTFGACGAGFDNCNTDLADGCEINLNADVNNCGTCGTKCSFPNAAATCDGSCVFDGCKAGYNTCDTNTANGCESNANTDSLNCGACGNDCTKFYQNANGSCNGGGTCKFDGCKPNFWDLDGDQRCEYACTKTSSVDEPDDAFTDSNCDGIDGDISKAIFVSQSTGNDANAGTKASPVRTIGKGLALASTAKNQVLVAGGTYPERVTLKSGISIYAGYSTSWVRGAGNLATIRGNEDSSGMIGVYGTNITAATVLDRVAIDTNNATSVGASNYGLYCNNCGGLWVKNSIINAGNGVAGNSGGNGSAGLTGGNGGRGSEGDIDGDVSAPGGAGGTSTCGGGAGGKGGAGGHKNTYGGRGLDGAGNPTGGTQGVGGTNPGGDGGPGDPGGVVGNGASGSAGDGGSIVSNLWTGNQGGNGSTGPGGIGGKGGGGGGGQNCGTFCPTTYDGTGHGGGGGGSGGCGGAGGTGGKAGGGSFGVFLANSNGVVFTLSVIQSTNGGRGGDGGTGGDGGNGGDKGLGFKYTPKDEVGNGGDGGSGGKGGTGGRGGGGAGGPSVGLYNYLSSATLVSTTLGHGTSGSGGTGGNNGVKGLEADNKL